MDFRKYNVIPKDGEIVIEGTITEPVHWDFTIRMCQDDLPGITKVLFKKDMLLFLIKAALTRNKANHWSADAASDDLDEPKKAKKTTTSSGSAGASGSSSSSDRAAKLAEAKARAAQAKAATSAASTTTATTTTATATTATATATTATDEAPKPAATPAASAPAASAPTAPAVAKERPKFDAAQPKLPRAKVKADKSPEPTPTPKPKRSGAPLAGDDYSRGLKAPVDSGTAPSPASFATGKSVSFGAPAVKPPVSQPSSDQSTKEAPKKPTSKQASASNDSKSKKSATDTKTAANGGKKSVEAAEGTKS